MLNEMCLNFNIIIHVFIVKVKVIDVNKFW